MVIHNDYNSRKISGGGKKPVPVELGRLYDFAP